MSGSDDGLALDPAIAEEARKLRCQRVSHARGYGSVGRKGEPHVVHWNEMPRQVAEVIEGISLSGEK